MEDKFYDFDIPYQENSIDVVARVLDAGYTYIALSQSVSIDDFAFKDDSRKKSKKERQSMRTSLAEQLRPPPAETVQSILLKAQQRQALVSTCTNYSRPRVFRRLTLTCESAQYASDFFREFANLLSAFDIVSFHPLTEEALSFVCDKMPPSIDLVSLTPSTFGNSVRLSGQQCSQFADNGLHLEFKYAPLVQPGNSSARSSLAFYFSQLFCLVRPSTISRLIVVSSGASSGLEVRRPLAVSSVLECLGMPPKIVLDALTRAPYNLLTHGLYRSRTVHGAVALLRLLPMASVVSVDYQGESCDAEANKGESSTPESKEIEGSESPSKKKIKLMDPC